MCCTRLAENTGCKKSPTIRHLGTIAQISRAVEEEITGQKYNGLPYSIERP